MSTFAAAGCSDSPAGTDGGGDSDGGAVIDAAAPVPDAAIDAAPPDYCDDLPPLPTSHVRLGYVPPAEDFTFDTHGNLVGVSIETSALTYTPYGGPPQSIVPGVSSFARGTRYLPSGDLLVADPETSTLKRITPTGSVTPVISGLPDPNGLVIGRDGFAYLTHGGGQLRRIDPDTGDYTLLVNTGNSYDGIVFSLDYQTLYFDEENGVIHALDIASGTVSNLATLAIGDLLDSMTMDECGNLYVVQMGGVIWRVTPEGASEHYYDFGGGGGGPPPDFVFLPAANFGSGIGGWKRDALYIMDFENGVYEVETGGIRGRLEPHLAASP